MRFKLTLEVNKKAFGNRLPINYQYEQSCVIYKILARQIRTMQPGYMKMVSVRRMGKHSSFSLTPVC